MNRCLPLFHQYAKWAAITSEEFSCAPVHGEAGFDTNTRIPYTQRVQYRTCQRCGKTQRRIVQ